MSEPELGTCHFGCRCYTDRLTHVYYPEGCWVYPHDNNQWLCPHHTIKGLQNNEGYTVEGYLHDKQNTE